MKGSDDDSSPFGRQPHSPIPQLMAALRMQAQEELTKGGNRKGRQSYPPVPILGRHKIAATQYAPWEARTPDIEVNCLTL